MLNKLPSWDFLMLLWFLILLFAFLKTKHSTAGRQWGGFMHCPCAFVSCGVQCRWSRFCFTIQLKEFKSLSRFSCKEISLWWTKTGLFAQPSSLILMDVSVWLCHFVFLTPFPDGPFLFSKRFIWLFWGFRPCEVVEVTSLCVCMPMLSGGAVPHLCWWRETRPFYSILLDLHAVRDGLVLCKPPGRLWAAAPEACLPSPFPGLNLQDLRVLHVWPKLEFLQDVQLS